MTAGDMSLDPFDGGWRACDCSYHEDQDCQDEPKFSGHHSMASIRNVVELHRWPGGMKSGQTSFSSASLNGPRRPNIAAIIDPLPKTMPSGRKQLISIVLPVALTMAFWLG
jgi:hypothetical protein